MLQHRVPFVKIYAWKRARTFYKGCLHPLSCLVRPSRVSILSLFFSLTMVVWTVNPLRVIYEQLITPSFYFCHLSLTKYCSESFGKSHLSL